MEAAESTLVPGYRLDRYELLCPIASGGMASVWLARLRGKRGFEKLFAIKTIKTELISDPHFQEMFLDEARIASRIVHPNVAQILDLGEQNDILYIAMEYVDGDSLAKISRMALKKRVALPPGVALRVVAETCAGLHAAHQLRDADGENAGVVHRDVSPQNVLVTTTGTSKVIDFGLVKARNRAAGETGQGVVKGKIRYMAPEQVGGKRSIDHRADVWAAGMCLYELLVGHVPYNDEDDLDVVKRLMGPDPAPRIDVAIAPQLEALLAKALAREPEARFESCAALKKAIEGAIHQLGLAGETDDVAEFIKTTLPDLATKRAQTIEGAIRAADSRANPGQGPVGSLEGLPADIGFAKTEVSSRTPASQRGPNDDLPLTRRDGAGAARGDASDPERSTSSSESRTTSATSLREQLGERKKRSGLGVWLTALVVMGGGAVVLYPRIKAATTVDPTPAASVSASASAAASDAPPASASAAGSTSAEPPALASAPPPARSPELDPFPDLDDASARGARPAPQRPSPAGRPAADAGPPAPTFNPAWSILTNPPDAAAAAPPPAPATNDN